MANKLNPIQKARNLFQGYTSKVPNLVDLGLLGPGAKLLSSPSGFGKGIKEGLQRVYEPYSNLIRTAAVTPTIEAYRIASQAPFLPTAVKGRYAQSAQPLAEQNLVRRQQAGMAGA